MSTVLLRPTQFDCVFRDCYGQAARPALFRINGGPVFVTGEDRDLYFNMRRLAQHLPVYDVKAQLPAHKLLYYRNLFGELTPRREEMT